MSKPKLFETVSTQSTPGHLTGNLNIYNITQKIIRDLDLNTRIKITEIASIQPKLGHHHWMNEDFFVIFKKDALYGNGDDFSMNTKISKERGRSRRKEAEKKTTCIPIHLVKKRKYWHIELDNR